jgi:hypothetical protein
MLPGLSKPTGHLLRNTLAKSVDIDFRKLISAQINGRIGVPSVALSVRHFYLFEVRRIVKHSEMSSQCSGPRCGDTYFAPSPCDENL